MLTIGKIQVKWLNGGFNQLDGGAMFGAVPKVLWERKYPANENNQIPLRTDPVLLIEDNKIMLIDSGLGNGKYTEKQKRNLGITEESSIHQSLKQLELTPDDITDILMTHMHSDHAAGLTMWNDDEKSGKSIFANAKIFVQEKEWHEMNHPTIRSKSTYFERNYRGIEEQVVTFSKEIQITESVTLIHTGGHSIGHSIIRVCSNEGIMYHFGDILPTHAHANPLWVMAYDDYPMESIYKKDYYLKKAKEEKAWCTFYHDNVYYAIKYNEAGEIVEKLQRI